MKNLANKIIATIISLAITCSLCVSTVFAYDYEAPGSQAMSDGEIGKSEAIRRNIIDYIARVALELSGIDLTIEDALLISPIDKLVEEDIRAVAPLLGLSGNGLVAAVKLTKVGLYSLKDGITSLFELTNTRREVFENCLYTFRTAQKTSLEAVVTLSNKTANGKELSDKDLEAYDRIFDMSEFAKSIRQSADGDLFHLSFYRSKLHAIADQLDVMQNTLSATSIYREGRQIYLSNQAVNSPEPIRSESSVTNLTTTNATINFKIYRKTGTDITTSGVRFGESPEALYSEVYDQIGTDIDNHPNYFVSWFDVNSDLGVKLVHGKTYYYQGYVTCKGQEYKSKVQSFTTNSSKSTGLTVSASTADGITSDNATLRSVVLNPNRSAVVESGVYFGTSPESLYWVACDRFEWSYAKIDSWFDLKNAVGIDLEPGTTYYWQPYAISGEKVYKGDVKSFVTL